MGRIPRESTMSGVADELFVYLATDEEGHTGVAFFETTGGTRIPLVAESLSRAEGLKAVAAKLATIIDRPIQLARFSVRENLETFEP
jgi:hypothetical protein